MFLTPQDIGQVIYNWQVDQITGNDENIVLQALAAGEEETRSYLEANPYQRENLDGRRLYDVAAIFSATGTDRNALILQQAVTLAKWHLVQLCNADVIYDAAKDRYDRSISWLKQLSKGDITLSTLPTITLEENQEIKAFSYGSRTKFSHE